MNTKTIFTSKTFWIQVLAILCALFPPVNAFMRDNPVEFVAMLAAVNVLVRFLTKGEVTIFPVEGNNGGSSGGTTGLPLMVMAAAGFSMAGVCLLPSCTAIGSAITGDPLRASEVARVDDPTSEPVLIATRDLLDAEDAAEHARETGSTPAIYGLYDAGRAAEWTRQVVEAVK
jgi:hypothetical protein